MLQGRYRRHFNTTQDDDTWIAAGLRARGYEHAGGARRSSGEAFVGGSISRGIPSSEILPFVFSAEVSHDFGRFDATYADVGALHSIGFGPLRVDLTAHTSASNYPTLTGVRRSFGRHTSEAAAWVNWLVPVAPNFIRLGIGGGRAWTVREIGPARNWIALRLRFEHTGS